MAHGGCGFGWFGSDVIRRDQYAIGPHSRELIIGRRCVSPPFQCKEDLWRVDVRHRRVTAFEAWGGLVC